MKHLVLTTLIALGCATAEPPPGPATAADAPRRRRRRRRRRVPPPPVDADGGAAPPRVMGSFGTPVVAHPGATGRLRARALPDGRIVCEGDAPEQRASTQSPFEPTAEMIALSFGAVRERVVACAPPRNAEGRFSVRVRVSGSGLPQDVAFPEGTERATARCVGRALCALRTTAFRATFATIPYAFELPAPTTE